MAVRVQEERDGLIRRSVHPVDDDRDAADRLVGCGDPLFPLVGVLWFLIGVQE
jgi:hypothetical protein